MIEVKVIGQMDNKMDNTFESANRVYDTEGLSPTVNTCGGGGLQPKVIVASRGRNPQNPSDRTPGADTEQRLEPNSEGICNTLTSVQKDNLVLETNTFIRVTEDGFHLARNDEKQSSIQGTHVTFKNGKAHCMGTSHIPQVLEPTVKIKQATQQGYAECKLGGVADLSYRIRKLTPLECWKLMDFTEVDFRKAEAVNSNTQLYKQAGNSIVKAVLMAIFKQMM